MTAAAAPPAGPPAEPALIWAATGLAAVLEWLLFAAVAGGSVGPAEGTALHVALVGVLAAVVQPWRRDGGRARSRYGLLLLPAVALMGPFGASGVLLSLAAYAAMRRRATSFEDWYLSLFDQAGETDVERLYERIVAGRTAGGGDVASFADILRTGTLAQKQALLALLARDFKPQFAPILLAALKDATPVVRVQAASAVVAIETQFTDTTIALKKAADAAADDFDAVLALARHYDDYAYSGLLDRERARECRAEALAAYRAALALRADRLDLRARIARLLLRDDRADEAADWLSRCRAEGYRTAEMDDWLLECFYRLRRWDDLRDLAAERTASGEPLPAPVAEALALWRPQAAASPEEAPARG